VQREGLVRNHKRTERLYREEQLAVQRRRRRTRATVPRVPAAMPAGPGERWNMDIVHDVLALAACSGA
jgi:putative transposase